MAKRTNFLLYIDHLQATLPLLSMTERGELLTSLAHHATDPEAAPPFSSDRVLMAYNIMAGAMDANFEKYDKTVEKRRAAAQARYNSDANVSKSMQMHASASGTDTVTGTKTDTGTKTKTVTKTGTDILFENSSTGAEAPATTTAKRGRFKKPTLEEVRDYCESEGMSSDPEAFWDYYEANGWTTGKAKVADWKALLRNWERREHKKVVDDWFKGLEEEEEQ